MTPAKPPSAAQTARPPTPMTPLGKNVPLLLKGAAFANILGAATPPKVNLTPQSAPQQTGKMQPSTPAIVTPVHADPEKHARGRGGDAGDLDPSTRQAAQLAPPVTTSIEADRSSAAQTTNARVSLEELVPQLVKKIAWSGDARHGTVRMELGAGELAGSTLTVSAEHGRVSVDIQTPPGTDVAAWRERMASSLEARGLSIDSIEIH